MNGERKQLWIDALRSGEFVQARGSFSTREEVVDEGGNRLQQQDCCLSVLTRVAIANGLDTVRYRDYCDSALDPTPQVLIDPEDVDNCAEDEVAERNDDGSAWVWETGGSLPIPVAEWIGVRGSNPTLDGITAIERNDSREQSFEEIAAAIEATP